MVARTDELLPDLGHALYEAKSAGRNCARRLFDESRRPNETGVE